MKRLVATLLRRTREQLERHGVNPPIWTFHLAQRIKIIANIVPASLAPVLPSDDITGIPLDELAVDLAYVRSLQSGLSPLPSVGIHLMVDLRVTQIYRERGIPRYALALLIELAKQRPDFRYSWLVEDGEMPLHDKQLAECGQFVRIADIASLPRITHYLQACMFDRSRDARVLFPADLANHRPQFGAIFYDFIPWLFPTLYLNARSVAHSYMRAAEILPVLGRVFAISECSRIDAIAFGCEPERVVAIYGGYGADRFAASPADLPNIPERYWLCIGGDDPRKNLKTLFQAFAKVRQNMVRAPALVVVCALTPTRRIQLLSDAMAAGLDTGGLVLTGYIHDTAMPSVIKNAIATISPSLYEGLGLPVLESYQFGRAALVSDNSSLKELAPPECRFDPSKPEAIAEAVLRFEKDPAIARASLEHARRILNLYSWKFAAGRVAEWCESGRFDEPGNNSLDVIASLPPDQSGVSLYAQKTMASTPWKTRFFVPGDGNRLAYAVDSLRRTRHKQRSSSTPPQILPISTYRPRSKPAVWILGNSEHHVDIVDMLVRAGQMQDILYLHEARLDELIALYRERKKKAVNFSRKVRNLNDLLGVIEPRNILVNSNFAGHIVRSLPNAKSFDVQVLFLPLLETQAIYRPRREDLDRRPLIVMHVGILGKSKRPEQVVAACEWIRQRRPLRLIFAGYDVANYLRIARLERSWVEAVEKPSHDELVALMQEVDVGVQLRWPQHGESSGAVNQWIGLRKPVVVTAGGSFDDFAGAAWMVSPEGGPDVLGGQILKAAQEGVPSGIDEFISKRTIEAWQNAFQTALTSFAFRNDGSSEDAGIGGSLKPSFSTNAV